MNKSLLSLISLVGAMLLMGMSGWTPAPSSGGIPEIPDTLESVKITADSLYWTDAFGEYLSMSDAVYFTTFPDSSYSYQPFMGSVVYQYPGISHFYYNVYVGTGFKLTEVHAFLRLGASRTFAFRVYRLPNLGGEVLFDSTVTLGSAAYTQEITWFADSIELYDDSISVEIEDDWGQNFTLMYDSTSVSRLYVKDFEGTFYLQEGIDPGAYISGIRTSPATTPVVVGVISKISGGFFASGLSITNLYADTLSVGVLQPSNIVGDGMPLSTDGVTAVTDTCFTSNGDMFVFINGLLVDFLATP